MEFDPLPAVIDAPRRNGAPGAPQLHDAAPGNICFRWVRGDENAVRGAFASAAHVVSIELFNNRLIGGAIEPRAAIAVPATGNAKLTLLSSTQIPHHIRRMVAEQLGLPESAMRVIAPDVGGGFGYKGKLYPEESIVAFAARRLQRPVRWVATRAESFISDNQGRDHATKAELALDADGHFLALRVNTLANLGAYVSTFGAAIPSAIYSALLAGVYRTPAISVESIGVFTNTIPTDAYRGAGRPEACYVLERLADRAADKLSLDRAEIRRRNLIPASAMPYKTPIGPTYDSGDFPRLLARVAGAWRLLEIRSAPHSGQENRPAARVRHGVLRRVVGRRPDAFCRRARRTRGILRKRFASGRARRSGARGARHPQPRPGPRHVVCADPGDAAWRAGRENHDHRGRHRSRPVRHRHIRVTLDRGRRLRARSRGRQDHRQGQADRGPSARSRTG